MIFDDELTGSQIQNIEKEMQSKNYRPQRFDTGHFCQQPCQNRTGKNTGGIGTVPIYSYQGLKGCGSILERQGGGVGTRGPR